MIFVVAAKKHTQKNILISIRLFLHLIFLSLKTKGQFLNHSNQNTIYVKRLYIRVNFRLFRKFDMFAVFLNTQRSKRQFPNNLIPDLKSILGSCF